MEYILPAGWGKGKIETVGGWKVMKGGDGSFGIREPLRGTRAGFGCDEEKASVD